MKSFFRAVAGLRASVVLLFVLLTMSVLLGGCFGDEKDQKAAAQAMPVKVIKVTEHQFPVMGEYVAQIQALKTVEIKARVQGHIKERLFTEGQRVKEGQLLFIIDPRPYNEALKKAEAELASTRATLAKAKKDYKRFKALFDQGAVSREEFDSKITDKQVLEANVSNAKAQVEQANLDLGFTQIKSPMDGIIGRTQVEPGTLVAAEATVLVTVSAVDPVYVNFSIPEREYLVAAREIEANKKAGKPARGSNLQIILADGDYYAYNGTFNMADRAVDSSTGTLGIRAEFPNPERILRDGQYAKVVVCLKEYPSALVVPTRALLDVQGRKSLLTVSNGTVVEKHITVDYSDDRNTVVKTGIESGTLIIADGVNKIRPGTPVTPQISPDSSKIEK
ncbi:efflux RND transporter periplasmic adaptor subunit [Maridesulfovibrio salexigens]|uniref:Efflux transporter, RND family, MFP subunit n=1 Tax=Maridesulfovibrio salexigens (strain ATCC 14822 / DSM 2638 / NCIMB 8403 / VKM B-1763) TaxID=526222 RepID=C6BRV8_MARSD|nr:efflux RND transporter periplasmic adaptor subunit [Maridesulfovibrio salexigens]ACS81341.1 efflux transporter, RND family, MFP subunit [Maridesulfovibrio salexigens DSM 2638]